MFKNLFINITHGDVESFRFEDHERIKSSDYIWCTRKNDNLTPRDYGFSDSKDGYWCKVIFRYEIKNTVRGEECKIKVKHDNKEHYITIQKEKIHWPFSVRKNRYAVLRDVALYIVAGSSGVVLENIISWLKK